MINVESSKDINRKAIGILGKIYGIILFLMGSGAIIPVMRQQVLASDDMATDNVIRMVWYCIYIITILLILFKLKRLSKIIFSNKLIWILLGFAFLSITWSASPTLTLRRCVALFFTQIIGVYLYLEFGFDGLIDILKWTSIISIILCFVFSIFFPKYGIQNDGVINGVWRGIYVHKNSLGLNIAIYVPLWTIIFLERIKTKTNKGILPLIFIILSIILLLKSESKTALSVCLVTLSLIPFSLILRKDLNLAIGVFFSMFTLVGSIIFYGSGIIKKIIISMGKDVTLTGRTEIWKLVMQAIEHRTLFGYGYGAFWQGFEGPSKFISNLLDVAFNQAHNGYLNITVELGIVGLIIFSTSLIQNIVNALRVQLWCKNYNVIFSIVFLIYLLILNMSESLIVGQNTSSWIIYCFISVYLSNELKNGIMSNKQDKKLINLY